MEHNWVAIMRELIINRKSLVIGITTLVLVLIMGLLSIIILVRHEKQRDLANWRITLGVMADNKAGAIRRWATAQFAVLQELADNGSLQMYTDHLMRQKNDRDQGSEPAQLTYLRNLIFATAEKEGFMDTNRSSSPIKANIAFQANYSLALLDRTGTIITATPGTAAPDESLAKAIAKVFAKGKSALYDIRLSRQNEPLVGFIVPVFALRVQQGQPEVIGALVGIKHAGPTLFPLLHRSGPSTLTDEAYLIRRDGNLITYLSPLADDTGPLQRQLAADDPILAGAYAVNNPGSFAKLSDYGGTQVLVTSRALTGLPWILVQKIDVKEALSESRVHQRFLFSSLLLGLLFVTALLLAAWWYDNSIRQRELASELLNQSEELRNKTRLLGAITNNISDVIFLLDSEARIIFANPTLARQLRVAAEDLAGKGLGQVFGAETARQLLPHLQNCLAGESTLHVQLDLVLHTSARIFAAAFTPVAYQNEAIGAALISLHDITELQKSQKRQERLLEQLIRALMRSIDRHDPYSANHSAKTTTIAMAIARVMNLKEPARQTLEIAANLCNLGKLMIPGDILTKAGDLTTEEKEILYRESEYAASILADIDFDGPVLETIVQKLEHVDGSGTPKGMRGDDILPTARILAVANSFVAMISPRAYRDKYSIRKAVDTIVAAADTRYDRQVTAALFHVVENMIDWEKWQHDIA
jgi:PAS domain S-box-containing protein